MSNITQNLRFILWSTQVPQTQWIDTVRQWAASDQPRARELLAGVEPLDQEVRNIAQAVSVPDQEIVFADLLRESGINVWRENVAHLVNTLKHGQQKKLAAYLGLDSSGTITKWKTKQVTPEKKHKQGLQDFFGIPLSLDLEKEALFLSPNPVDITSQRAWVHKQLDQISDRTLQQLFPALERLLREP